MANRGSVAFEMKGDNGGGHHRKLGMFLGHLMDRGVCSLDRQLHQVLDVCSVDLMTKSLIEHLNSRFRSHLTGLGAADAISYNKDPTVAVSQKRIFIERASLV